MSRSESGQNGTQDSRSLEERQTDLVRDFRERAMQKPKVAITGLDIIKIAEVFPNDVIITDQDRANLQGYVFGEMISMAILKDTRERIISAAKAHVSRARINKQNG